MGVHLITGDDDSLLLAATSDLVHRLVGDGDRSLLVDEFDGDEYELRAVVDAAQTPPFLTDTRIVVARSVGRFGAADLEPLVAYLGDPLPTTELVLVSGGGRLPKALTDAVGKAAGQVVATAAPSRARDRGEWLAGQAAERGLKLDRPALEQVASWLGEDVGRVSGLLDMLHSTYGTGHTLRVDDVVPFLGRAGGVPPWDLTDAIDQGRTPAAIDLLRRMMGAGERHPLQVMAILHGHYEKMLALDGSDARDDQSAAAVLGVKSAFTAGKALKQYRALGNAGVARAIRLLAQADLDLRGHRDLPDELVMEVFVARLSRLAPTRR
jgi:DNA polymerase III subunit delta